MRIEYLTWSFIAFLAWMILEKMDNDIKWIMAGFVFVMILFGLFCSKKEIKGEDEDAISV